MTQIFTGTGLGLHNSSLGLGSYGPKGIAALGQGGESVYVNAATGNLVLRHNDGFLADAGFGIDLFQTYNSQGERSASWCFNLHSRLEFFGTPNQEGSSIIRTDEDGHHARLTWDNQKQNYRPEEGGTARVTWSRTGWTYGEGGQKTTYHYTQEGQLIQINDLDGHSVLFTYEQGQLIAISDKSGKQKITWSIQHDLIREVTASSEGKIIHHLHYDYDAEGRLHKVSRDLGEGKTYWITYDYVGDSNWVSTIKQSDGTQLQIDYDAQGRVKKLIDGEGRISIYDYSQGQTTVRNGLGESWTYYYDEKNRLTGVDGPEQYRIRYFYEGNHLSAVVQGKQTWRFDYNEAGDCILIEEPTGQITQRTYDAAHRLLSQTQYQAFDGMHHPIKPKTTHYLYDERGHLRFILAADGHVTEQRYTPDGALLSTRSYLYALYEVDALSEFTLNDLTIWAAQQNPQEIRLIEYHYDWRGQLTEEIHYNQVSATGMGLPTDALTTYTRYDGAGRLIEKSTPSTKGWHTTSYLYDDLGRLIQTTDNQNTTQRIEYDDIHQRIIQTEANGLHIIRLYDRSGLLLATTRLDETHNYGSTRYQYDAAGRLLVETGVDGLNRFFFYDAQGRLQAQINPQGQLTQYRYNEEGLLLQTHQFATPINTYGWQEHRPSYASINPQSSSKDRISQFVYDQYNQLAYTIDAQGAVIAYVYDAEGHVISKTAYANRLTEFNPEHILSLNALKLCASAQDRALFYYYDLQGRLSAEINGEGFACSYHYNSLNQLIETCHYANKVGQPLNGDWNHDKPILSSNKDIHRYSLYDARGLKVADIDGERYLTEYRYNDAGLLEARCAYEHAISRTITLDEKTILEHIRPSKSQNDHVTTYQYNDLGLLIEEKTQSGLITSYSYDEMGQVTLKTHWDEKTQTTRSQQLRYDALGRIIAQLNELGAHLLQQPDLDNAQIEAIWHAHSIHFTYDNAGLLLTKTNVLGQTTHYVYDEKGQLKYSINADGAVIETCYNAFNEVEFIRKYSAYLKDAPNELNCNALQSHLALLYDEHVDETTTYEYNNLGQLSAKTTGRHGLITSRYNAFGELELSTLSLDAQHNKENTYAYDKRGLLVNHIEDVGGLARSTRLEYDAFGWISKEVDGRANALSYLLNKRGERITLINASTQYKVISYDAFHRVLGETDYTHSKWVTLYSYDDQNNSLTLTHPLVGTKVVTQFNAFGDKITLIDANGHTTKFHYNEQGLLCRIDAPEQSFTQYQYNEAGQLLWQDDAGGHVIAYSYNAEGQVLSQTVDPNGLKLTTCYRYDGIGRQLHIRQANGCIKQFTYDDQGNLIQSCVDPEGLNLITRFTYDHRGLLITQTEVSSQGKNKVTAFAWDSLGRRTATTIDPEGLKEVTRYEYDANDNLIRQTDARQQSRHFIYDANNRCRYQINALGVVCEHRYDLNGNEIQTITYAQALLSLPHYTEEAVKATLLLDASHDQYQWRTFDGAGRLTRHFDALGYATLYDYDGQGNVIQKTKCLKPVSLEALKQGLDVIPDTQGARYDYFAYDGLNQLRMHCDTKGYVTESQYDTSGQLTAQTQYAHPMVLNKNGPYALDYFKKNISSDLQNDKKTQYAYDKAGRLCLEVSAKGVAKSYYYNELNQCTSTTTYALVLPSQSLTSPIPKSTNDRSTQYVYDAAGREVFRISSEGRVIERRYDEVGNVTALITHAKQIIGGQYTAKTLQEALHSESQDRSHYYQYDAAGRLLSETNAKNEHTRYGYDANGNVCSKTQANQALWTYRYDAANQLIETLSPVTEVTTANGREQRAISARTTYDSFGNVLCTIADATGIKQTRYYEYDLTNRLIKTIYPEVHVNNASNNASNQRQERIQTLVEEIHYNAFDEVIASRDKAGNWTHFAYDARGHLIYHLDTQGGLIQYNYDAFGRVDTKTRAANPIVLANDKEYTLEAIAQAQSTSDLDRHEYFAYDHDNQLIERSSDAVRLYNPSTEHYELSLKPTTHYIYNAFGELIHTATRINETQWAKTTLYYDKDGKQTALIDAEGYLTTYIQNAFGETQSMTEYALRAPSWDLEHYDTPARNAKDRTVSYTYDALGQLTSKTLNQVAIARLKNGTVDYIVCDLTTSYAYDALGHLTQTIDAKGNSAYCYYDALGQLIAQVAPQTQSGRAATTYAYDALGHLVETRRWAAGASTADTEHFLLKGATNQDILNQAEYDSEGQLICETDGLNHSTYYSYDANGNLARRFKNLTQIDGGILVQDTRYTYDSEHRVLQTATFKNNGTIKTEDAHYNMFGELIAKGIDGHLTTQVDYDRLGRVWRANTQGYYQIYVYDLADHVTQVVTSTNSFHPEHKNLGVDLSTANFTELSTYFNRDTWRYTLQRQNNTYDARGYLLIQSKESTTAQANENGTPKLECTTQSQTLDRWGNMQIHTNALGYQTHYEYNAFNEVITQELPEVAVMDAQGKVHQLKPVTHYAYDELGQAIALIDANGHKMYKEYDALGQVIAETNAQGHSRTKHYTLLNQLDSMTNELHALTTYTYDKANRLIAVVTPKTKQTYSYDEAGQLIQQKNGAEETTTFKYDTLGNQTAKRNCQGVETLYEYDDAGHKTKETDAKGNSQTWVYTEEGRLQQHKDLGNHLTTYEYNTNGMLIHESATQGKNINYYYQGDGALIHYADEARGEVVNYTYDAQGQICTKEASRPGGAQEGWVREIDHYQYDALGHLIALRRRNPNDTDSRFPEKDHALLAVDYDYDAVGNIRHTDVLANTSGYQQTHSEAYYTYDENNRMCINKGQLINDTIEITSTQGSILTYDAVGNIQDATQYEHEKLHHYHYVYNSDNQLELIQKDKLNLQSKVYDSAGRVIQENTFDAKNHLAQRNVMTYAQGLLIRQVTFDGTLHEQSQATYKYDSADNMLEWSIKNHGDTQHASYTLRHQYSYALWDTYQQQNDEATLTFDGHTTTQGKSIRIYDVNGLLQDAIDTQADGNGKTNTTHYWNSLIEGIKSRENNEGQVYYLNMAGQTLGDLHLDNRHQQQLNIYSGFTPVDNTNKTPFTVTKGAWNQTKNDSANIISPEAPQDTLGVHTLQAGDTLEQIALEVYGDSGLWYLIADANGITDRYGSAGNDGPLYIGQRLNIPPVALGQHHTNATHKALGAHQQIGTTSATTPLPPPPPSTPRHNSLFAKIIVAVIATVTTVLTAGVLGLGELAGLSALFNTGLSVLAGGTMTTTASTVAAGFAAGFVGSIASQSVANVLGLQKSLDVTGALIRGLATAATAGVGGALRGISTLNTLKESITNLPISNGFNITSAAEMMEQNALNQGLNLSLRKHQHFNWEELGAATLTAGILGSSLGKNIDKALNHLDHQIGILSAEGKAILSAGAHTALSGTHFDATQVLTENLGDAIGTAVINTTQSKSPLELINDLSLADDLEKMKEESQAFNNYLARQLNGSEGYGDFHFNEYSAIPVSENSCPIPRNDNLMLYGSELSGFVGDVIYDNSVRFNEGQGALVNKNSKIVPLRPVLNRKEDIWSELNAMYGTNIDFSALSEFEGGQKLRGYLPTDDKGKVLGKSGVTIATGFDMGQYSEQEIKNFAFPKTLEEKLLPFAGAIKEHAKDLLPLALQTNISTEEANQIDFKIKGIHIKCTINSWNKHRLEDTPIFNDLTPTQQTVLFSRTFHQGKGMPYTNVARNFYKSALENNWNYAEKYLRNYNVTETFYKNRVNKEANLLKQERLSR